MPSSLAALGELNTTQWHDLQERVHQLENELKENGPTVDFAPFLPPFEAPHFSVVVVELVKTHLEFGYRNGQGKLLDEYVDRYPALGDRENLSADLIYHEYRVRVMCGGRPLLEDYRKRFPRQFAQLQQLVLKDPPPEPVSSSNHKTIRGSEATPSPAPLARVPTPTPLEGTLPQPLISGLLPVPPGYQLGERIGEAGGFGKVYSAYALGEVPVPVAIKYLNDSLEDDGPQQELEALRRIMTLRERCRYLIAMRSIQVINNRLIIVMEKADRSLNDRAKECRGQGLPGIPLKELLTYFTEAAEALDFLHDNRLIHRDVKPQNLLLMGGHAMVADFGILRPLQETVRGTNNPAGTFPYMAYEMLFDRKMSIHSDQYSLAVTWFEMRTGRLVFGKDLKEVFRPEPRENPDLSGVPEGEQKVLRRALAKEPDQRFPSCSAFAEALRKAHVLPPSPWRWVLLVALLMLGAVLGAWSYSRFWPTVEKVDWQPPQGWKPDSPTAIVTDMHNRRFYQRLVRDVGPGQKIVMVAITNQSSSDLPTFYMMENKVWNDVYAVFMADAGRAAIVQRHGDPAKGLNILLSANPHKWRDGGRAEAADPTAVANLTVGVDGPVRGQFPVFCVTATEAHCFAEWIGGRIPTTAQWAKATGKFVSTGKGPYGEENELGIGPPLGPWKVQHGEDHKSIYGVRQMAGNGYEWTRDCDNGKQIPLAEIALGADLPEVFYLGQSYRRSEALTFLNIPGPKMSKPCNEASFEIGFRVVLEQP